MSKVKLQPTGQVVVLRSALKVNVKWQPTGQVVVLRSALKVNVKGQNTTYRSSCSF